MKFFLVCLLGLLNINIISAGETVKTEPVYKVLRQSEWNELNTNGSFAGSPDDLRDGFMHMSPANQVERIIKKYFSKDRPIYIVKLAKKEFLDLLTWEMIHSGDIYPHLYNRPLYLEDMDSVKVLDSF